MSAPANFPPPTKKQARILWLSVTALAVSVLVGLLGMLMWGFGFVLNIMAPVLWPLAIAAVLSYLFDPVVDYFERKKIKRVWAILLVFFLCLLLVLGFLGSIIPRLVIETRDLISDFPKYSEVMRKKMTDWIDKSPWKRPGAAPIHHQPGSGDRPWSLHHQSHLLLSPRIDQQDRVVLLRDQTVGNNDWRKNPGLVW
jgi:hypothetical protein